MRWVMTLAVLLVGATLFVPGAEAQVGRGIRRAVAGKVDRKKQALQDSLAKLAGAPLDTGLARAARPLEEAATQAAERLAKAVAGLGPSDGRVKREEQRLEEALASGEADLPGLVFLPGTEFLDEPSAVTLAALRAFLRRHPGDVLIRGRASDEEALGEAAKLGRQRALAVQDWLIQHDIAPERLRVGGMATRPDGAAAIAVMLLH